MALVCLQPVQIIYRCFFTGLGSLAHKPENIENCQVKMRKISEYNELIAR